MEMSLGEICTIQQNWPQFGEKTNWVSVEKRTIDQLCQLRNNVLKSQNFISQILCTILLELFY